MGHRFTTPLFVIESVDTLVDRRCEKGLSRLDIAEKTGVRYEYITHYEQGYSYPSRDNYNKLAKYFNWEEWK